MSKIYKNQSALRLTLETGVALTGATLKIRYVKPDGSSGLWNATLSGTTAIYYDFHNSAGISELDQEGQWEFNAYITFSDGRIAPGEPVFIVVYAEGN